MIQKAGSSVESALADAHEQYIASNPNSEKLHLEGLECLPGGNTRSILHVNPFPLTFGAGEGARLTSVDNHTYVDLLGEYSAGIFGHSNRTISDAILIALKDGWNYGGQCKYEKLLARKVVDRFGASGIEQVRFTNSGTEANTMAIAAAITKTGRKQVLVCSGGYHGGTLIFPMEFIQNPQQPTSNLPHDYIFAPYNNIAETESIIFKLSPQSLAAILVEPLQGAGGCRPGSPRFLRFLRKKANEVGAVFIVDEVMTSRLGQKGYTASLDIRADIITLGKYVGGGMTFGAFGGRSDIMQVFNPAVPSIQHPGTYNNNVFTMSAGIVGLEIYNDEAVDRLNAMGEGLKLALQAIFIKHDLYKDSHAAVDIFEVDSFQTSTTAVFQYQDSTVEGQLPVMFVTGKGSLLSVRFSGQDRVAWQALLYHHLLRCGIYTAPRGYIALNLCLERSEIQRYTWAIEDFVITYKGELHG